ncbi:MAG TPA: type VII secretion protein EccB [Actinophytocola sp.]|uniref:type VII secretion protein EccB n=1 Tax=Actinophytocola sp. TaxID=1872138 RepID=UPI002DBE6F82|nr:type VII secretion protein EccB [Actinophytocola sp.]HEU5469630.1 type VII secretion protein EccB [Actinophytocola sp.]
MPSTPTTKSQVQAYRFVLRRMQSALVRKDAVMLHDPMRTHTRATVVGICLAAVGVVGFLIWGLLSQDPKPPDEGIVISKQSGQVYVLINEPRQLIPTFNLASARLLLFSRQNPGAEQQGGTATQIRAGNTGVVQPTMVDEDELRDIPRGRLTGIQNGPSVLPGNDQRIASQWAVCDEYILDRSLNNPASENRVETTVLAGVAELGPELTLTTALLVQAPDDTAYLVYRTPETANIRNANAVRAKVDMSKGAVRAALNLDAGSLRKITIGMLNAIPEAPELRPPPIRGSGETPAGFSVQNLKVGAVFQVERAGAAEQDIYVVQRDGIEPIKRSTADLIRFTESLNAREIPTVPPSAITQVPNKNVDVIEDDDFPAAQPEILTPVSNRVACLGWTVRGEGDNAESHTAVHVGIEVPLPRKADGSRYTSVGISTPGANGQRIDHFFMPPGRAAVVRGASSKVDFGTGPIYLVSDTGVKYGVPDLQTAEVLGLSNQIPAYLAITDLLPNGAQLSAQAVKQTYDSVPVAPGVFPTGQAGVGGN